MGEHADVGDGCVADVGEGLVTAVLVVVVVAFLAFIGIPLLVAAVDVILVLVLGVMGVLARLLLGRPWELESTSDRGDRCEIQVHGWRASQDRFTEIVELLGAGLPIPGATCSRADEGGSGADDRPGTPGDPLVGRQDPNAGGDEDRSTAAGRAVTWVSLVVLLAAVVILGMLLRTQRLGDADCPVPGSLTGDVAGPTLPARLVASGPLSLEDAVGGKYGSDARRSALDAGAVVAARHEDWQTDGDITLLRVMTFGTQQAALEYAAVDAETICAFAASTFTPAGLPDAAGVRQSWRSGPPGWWAGVVSDRRYVRAYVRTQAEDRGPILVADALKRGVLSPG